jgi:hypothetical protein
MSLSNAQHKLHRSIGRLDALVKSPDTPPEKKEALLDTLARVRARASLRLRILDVEKRHKSVLLALKSGALSGMVRGDLQHTTVERARWLSGAYLLVGWLKNKQADFSNKATITALDILSELPAADKVFPQLNVARQEEEQEQEREVEQAQGGSEDAQAGPFAKFEGNN